MHRAELQMICQAINTQMQAYQIDMPLEMNTIRTGTIEAVARQIAEAFKEVNPSFNTNMFLTACGVHEHWANTPSQR